jgi:hypothetical protein
MKKFLLLNVGFWAILLLFAGSSVKAQTVHFELGFSSSLPTGWVGNGIYMTGTASNRNTGYSGTFGGTNAPKFTSPAEIITTSYFTADTLSFWLMSNVDAPGDFKVEKSTDDGANWTELLTINGNGLFAYTQHKIAVKDNSASIKFRFSSTNKIFYMDDLSLYAAPPADDNAFLSSLGVNGVNFTDFASAKLDYTAALTYPTATVQAVPFNQDATVAITLPQPSKYFGTEAERTGTVVVTSKDQTVSQTYNIVFTVNGYHIQLGFPAGGVGNYAAPGWDALGTYTINAENNGIYDGVNAIRFTTLDGYLFSDYYKGVDTISFYTKVGTSDGSDPISGEKLIVKKKSKGEFLWTTLGTFVTGTDIDKDTWSKKQFLINDDKDSVLIKWEVESTDSKTRIYLDDIGISGHPTYMDPDYYTTSVRSLNTSKLNVYPNPAREMIFVDLPEGLNQAKLSVSNIIGQSVKTVQLVSKTSPVDVSDLPKGVYILKVEKR